MKGVVQMSKNKEKSTIKVGTMLRTLARSVCEYKKPAFLSPMFISLEVIMEVLIPTFMAYLIDNGINQGSMTNILGVGGLLILCCCISITGGVMSAKMGANASCGFAKNLRHDMYYKVQEYSFRNIDKFSTASLITRMTTDVTNVQNAFQMIIRIAVRAPMMLIFSLIMAFRINVKLSLLFLLVLPVLGIGLYFIMSKAHPIIKQTFKTYDKLNGVVQENLRGMRVVKIFVRENHEDEKFKSVSQKIYKGFSKAEKLMALNGPIMQFCMYTVTLLLAWFGAKMIVSTGNTVLKVGDLQALITYSTQILMSFMMVSGVFVMIIMSRASAERICEVLTEQSDIVNPENPVTEVKDGSITFEDVCFNYSASSERKNCLDHVNLDIKSGETIGIIGGTGSSKSTLVQLIPRLYDTTTGRVTVGGVDVRDYDIKTLRNAVSVVLQKNELFSGTIASNLRWGDENADDEQLVHAAQLAQADSFINEIDGKYDAVVEQGGTNVSGGQKQRICIARALLKKPKILILDDSTSAVDTKTDSLIQSAFRDEIPDTTKLIIAQRISSVEKADRIIVLDDGKINGFGTHEELLKNNEIYREVYESQTKPSTNQGGVNNG